MRGTYSAVFTIGDSTFQGIGMGPMLWNTFFSDVSVLARCAGGSEKVLVDGLSVAQEFDRLIALSECKAKLSKCETSLCINGLTEKG